MSYVDIVIAHGIDGLLNGLQRNAIGVAIGAQAFACHSSLLVMNIPIGVLCVCEFRCVSCIGIASWGYP